MIKQTTGVVLFNMGGPENLDAVEPFLVNVFSDRAIIELPLGRVVQPLFARAIARARRASVRRNYAAIGGGSPQLALTRAQAAALEERLNHGHNGDRLRFAVLTAFRYTRPSAGDAIHTMADRGIRRVITLPLYPHYSRATTGSSQADFNRALAESRWRPHGFHITHLHSYADDPLYLDAMADRVRNAYEAMTPEGRRKGVILFSAHGLPQKFVDAGDPYVGHIEATRRGLVERLKLPNRQMLAYQSRTGPVRWIGPGTEETIEELAADGVKHLLVVPLSFVSDHIETLYEIDQLFGDLARSRGIVEYCRPEALNTHPLFVESLARQVERAAGVAGDQAHDERRPPAALAGAAWGPGGDQA
ncbi:MAG TPA: ferrochelatase [Vicinamibacterales bacterium]|nr:ferrochelatase [Vicinamibacterales bacterium]